MRTGMNRRFIAYHARQSLDAAGISRTETTTPNGRDHTPGLPNEEEHDPGQRLLHSS
jgi:hypothetical protein